MDSGFKLYLLFVVSWFTHLGSRVPVFGMIRFDLLLIIPLFIIIFVGKNNKVFDEIKFSKTHKLLSFLLLYIIITLPLVQWPGSVVHYGIINFIKAVVFYYFTVYFVDSEYKLRKFIFIFILCQTFRILEPLYLHISEGYWGDVAYMGSGGVDFMNRLSGAPKDIVNPNGLAFIITSMIPFYYYLSKSSRVFLLGSFVFLPLGIYALVLTGSRSGFLGLLIIISSIFVKAKKKAAIVLIISIAGLIVYSYMNDNQKDRYLSIFNSNTKNSSTAEGRTEGVKRDFEVAMNRPFVGHGLGTSREANANFGGIDQLSHNLYAEIAQELGFIGLAIFILLINSIINNYRECMVLFDQNEQSIFLSSFGDAMQVWIIMNILFSFASYGLSSYEWYLFAGLSVTLKNVIAANHRHLEMLVC